MSTYLILTWLVGLMMQPGTTQVPTGQDPGRMRIVIDNFETYQDGGLPTRWKYLADGRLVDLAPQYMREKEQFYVVNDRGNNVLRVYTDGEAVHLTMPEQDLAWDLRTHPRLAWDWRALQLPPGAREDEEKMNDTAAGMYVIFAFDGLFIKRPRAIKYTYSSMLPVGTEISYGKLKVIVVSSGKDGAGAWQHIERDVVADYRRVFGGDPPDRPLSLRLWGDSDNTRSIAEADFDNIALLPGN